MAPSPTANGRPHIESGALSGRALSVRVPVASSKPPVGSIPRRPDRSAAKLRKQNLFVYAIARISSILFGTAVFVVRGFTSWLLGMLSGMDLNARQAKLGSQLTEYLQKLGGTFIKLGQFLSARSDFVPPVYCEQLSSLFDDAEPFPDEEAIALMVEELGPEVVDSFPGGLGESLAAASFGQVYRVTLPDGNDIALKVQRPNARGNTRVDLFLLGRIAALLDFSTLLTNVDVRSIAREFKQWTMEELDYLHEARAAEMIRENLISSPARRTSEAYPEVYWEFTSGRTLALEFFDGIWLTDLLRPESASNHWLQRIPGARRLKIAHNIFGAFLNQVFVDGYFHGDPHPGNIVILEDDIVGMVDFGIVGKMSRSMREHTARVLHFASANDTRRTFYEASEMFDIPKDANVKKLQTSYESNLEDWYQASKDPRATKREKSFAGLLLRNIETVRSFGISLPTNMYRYYRSFITLDPLLREIAPDFEITTEMKKFFRDLYQKDLLSDYSLPKYLDAILQYHRLGLRLPQGLDTIMRSFERVPEQITRFERTARIFAAGLFINAARIALLLAAYAALTALVLKNRALIWQGISLNIGVNRIPLLIGTALLLTWIGRRLLYHSGKV